MSYFLQDIRPFELHGQTESKPLDIQFCSCTPPVTALEGALSRCIMTVGTDVWSDLPTIVRVVIGVAIGTISTVWT